MFLGYIHYFRALAIFFIVAGHSIDNFLWLDNSTLERVLRIVISNGSTLFVFIAGYLFQHLLVKYNTKKYVISKLKNVIIPYFIVSIPAIIIFVFYQQREAVWEGFYDNPQWLQVFLFYLTGKHLAPLWFIPMITLFYLVAPLLAKADKNEKIYYLLPLFILISCLVSRGLPYQSFVHFFSAYLLGMYCSKFKISVNLILQNTNFLIGSFLLVVAFIFSEFYFTTGYMTYYNHLQKLCLSLFFLGLFIKFNPHLTSKYISTVADTSFGVFFIHSYLVTGTKLIYEKAYGHLPEGNIVFHIIISIVLLMTCVFLIVQIRRVFGKNSRYLVGS